MIKALIVDDDRAFSLMLNTFLEKNGFQTQQVYNAKDALAFLKTTQVEVILTDFRLPDATGVDLLRHFKSLYPQIPVILMTGYADIRIAVESMKMGAHDYVTKPLNPDEILATLKQAVNKKAPLKEVVKKADFRFVSGQSEVSAQLNKYIQLVAPTEISVLVQGESGTGKEYVSRLIHLNSKRKDKPFVAIDCGALSKDLAGSELFGHMKGAFTGALADKPGQFELANGGTLFLDEIGNLSYDIQVKLLRALQERKIRRIGASGDLDVDVRLIAATNEDLQNTVKNGDFREDLYHRLNEFKIAVPALRARDQDRMEFAGFFLQEANKQLEKSVKSFSKEVIDIFEKYKWPGNLREMKNVVRRAVLLSESEMITLHQLPPEILYSLVEDKGKPETNSLKVISAEREKEMIIDVLQKVKFNKSKAATELGIDRKTLYNKLKQYQIEL